MDIRNKAVRYVESVLRSATDWQEGQTALFDHPEFGPYLAEFGWDDAVEAQRIIAEAEARIGNALPY